MWGVQVKTYDGVEAFLRANQLDKPFLASLARAHYTSRYCHRFWP